ncbi:TlpA family protein disulfide reductase [Azonexus sp.]|uniref:TlpA family protein disulfide reductase n=1 Tax=Azonexus sp. TaxID=1872668 RepID=UPI0035AFF66E
MIAARPTFACSLALAAGLLTSGAGRAGNAGLDFELSDGSRFVRLSELPARTTVVNFWCSDCPPCRREMPTLAAAARRGQARVVAVALQRPAETQAADDALRAALNPPLLSLHGPSEPRGLLARFGDPALALPHTVVLDARRQPCARRSGEIDAAWLDAAIARCSASQDPS